MGDVSAGRAHAAAGLQWQEQWRWSTIRAKQIIRGHVKQTQTWCLVLAQVNLQTVGCFGRHGLKTPLSGQTVSDIAAGASQHQEGFNNGPGCR